jgi:hypothetical protein
MNELNCPYCGIKCATFEARAGHMTVCTGDRVIGAPIVAGADGSDTDGLGTWMSPYRSLTKALSFASPNRPNIFMLPGNYPEPAPIIWPNINNLRVSGLSKLGNVNISCAVATAGVIVINPTYTAATFLTFLENVAVTAISANNGAICIDNAHMSKKLMPYFVNVSTNSGAYGTIVVAHSTAGQAIRIRADGLDEISGLVSLVAANSGDQCRIRNSTLAGGLSSSGAIASEIALFNTVVLTGGLASIATENKLSHVACVYRSNADPAVYTVLADVFATYA